MLCLQNTLMFQKLVMVSLKAHYNLAEDLSYIDSKESEELRKSIDLLVGGTHKLIDY